MVGIKGQLTSNFYLRCTNSVGEKKGDQPQPDVPRFFDVVCFLIAATRVSCRSSSFPFPPMVSRSEHCHVNSLLIGNTLWSKCRNGIRSRVLLVVNTSCYYTGQQRYTISPTVWLKSILSRLGVVVIAQAVARVVPSRRFLGQLQQWLRLHLLWRLLRRLLRLRFQLPDGLTVQLRIHVSGLLYKLPLEWSLPRPSRRILEFRRCQFVQTVVCNSSSCQSRYRIFT